MLPWLVKPAALVSVLGPLLLSVIRRVWPAGTSLARVFAPSRMKVSGLAAGAASSRVAPARTNEPLIVPPW